MTHRTQFITTAAGIIAATKYGSTLPSVWVRVEGRPIPVRSNGNTLAPGLQIAGLRVPPKFHKLVSALPLDSEHTVSLSRHGI